MQFIDELIIFRSNIIYKYFFDSGKYLIGFLCLSYFKIVLNQICFIIVE